MQGGTTVLFVSHDINAIRRFCTRIVWLRKGQVQEEGDVNAISDRYLDFLKIGDEYFDEIARMIVNSNTASTSSLQRRYNIGYNRAGRIMDQLEAAGIVGPSQGGKPRAVLVDAITLETILGDKNS